MFGIGSRTYYAMWHNMLFNFEYIRDRNYFVDNTEGARVISANEAYSSGLYRNKINIKASCALSKNNERRRKVNQWYDNKRHNL